MNSTLQRGPNLLTDLPIPTSQYVNIVMSAGQLLMLLFYGLCKLKKRVANNDFRVKTLEYKLSKLKKTVEL